MTTVKSPCKDCPGRHVGCHSDCERYIAYKEALKLLNEIRVKILHDNNTYSKRIEKDYRRKVLRVKAGRSP